MVGIPLMKVGFLALRQVTRPVAKRIVQRAKEGHNRRLCIALGRVSLGMSGAIMELSRQEEVKAAQERSKKSKKDTDPNQKAASSEGVKAGGSSSKTSSPPLSDWAKEVGTVSPRSRSLLESISYGPLPQKKYDASVFLNPNRRTGEAMKIFILYPYQSTWELFRNRFLAPYPEDKLVDAGADLLVELMAFTILAMILSYELNLQFKSTARKEAILLARIERLEKQVARLEKAHNFPVRPFGEEDYPEHLREEITRFRWMKKLFEAIHHLLVHLAYVATRSSELQSDDALN